MKKNLIIFTICLYFLNQAIALSEEKNNKIGDFLKDTLVGMEKSFFRSSKTLEKEIISTIQRIDKECCEDKFSQKNELVELKKIIEDSYKNKDHVNPITNLDFRKSKKYLLQVNLEKADKLLLENTKARLLFQQEENKKIQSSNLTLDQKLKKSQENNSKLQKEVEDIIKNYDVKLNQLENENKNLKEEISKLEKKIKDISKKDTKKWWNK